MFANKLKTTSMYKINDTQQMCCTQTANICPNGSLICLFGVYRPTREFFTHMETSPLPVKACKF